MGLKESGLRGSLRSTSSVLPAFFDVTITNTNSPVQEGDILTVDYGADNTGDAQDTQDIRLEIDSVQEDVDPDVMLAGGASTTGTLEWDTTDEAEAEYTATVLSDDDSDSVTVEIGSAIPDTLAYPILRSIDEDAQIEMLLAAEQERDPDLSNTESTDPDDGSSVKDGGTSVYDWEDLDQIRDDKSESYTLENNLDSSTQGYDGIGDQFKRIGLAEFDGTEFSGTFDGQGNVIADLILADDEDDNRGHGLFGGVSGKVVNLGVHGTFDVTNFENQNQVGPISGNNSGTIEKCMAFGEVVCPSPTSNDGAGGLVGRHRGDAEIVNCYAIGSVSNDNDDNRTGGLVGRCQEPIENSYATVVLSGGTEDGFAGTSTTPTITNGYWDTDRSNTTTSELGEPLSQSEMTFGEAANNMDGFDFDDVWDTVE